MQPNELMVAAAKTAELMEHFKRQSHDITQNNLQITDNLARTANAIPGIVKQSTDSAISNISKAILREVEGGLNQPIAGFNRQMLDTTNSINGAAHGLTLQISRLETLHKALIWKVLITVASAMLILIGGGGSLQWHYKDVIKRNKIEAELLRAYNQADVTLCNGRLCVNLDEAGKRYGAKGKYRSVKLR